MNIIIMVSQAYLRFSNNTNKFIYLLKSFIRCESFYAHRIVGIFWMKLIEHSDECYIRLKTHATKLTRCLKWKIGKNIQWFAYITSYGIYSTRYKQWNTGKNHRIEILSGNLQQWVKKLDSTIDNNTIIHKKIRNSKSKIDDVCRWKHWYFEVIYIISTNEIHFYINSKCWQTNRLMFVIMYLIFVDMKHCINKNSYILCSQWWHNLHRENTIVTANMSFC